VPILAADVVVGFVNRDPGSVRAVYREYDKLVFGVALKVLGDRLLAEEAAQETFVRAWKAAARYDPGRELGPWLATIARRTAIDVHRRTSRARRCDLAEEDCALVEAPPSAERAYDVWEVRQALAQLPPEEREVVRLHHLEGFSLSNVAERLGVALGTVKSRSFRAHRRLAGLLGQLRDEQGETPSRVVRTRRTDKPQR
jgi:RNA polymerase sigma factor (sigma-70 family)